MSEQQTEEGTPPAEGEAARVESLDSRFAKIETRQAEQDGVLQKILTQVSGKATAAEGEAHAKAQAHTERKLDEYSSIADQVRRAVEAVGAEKEQQDRESQHAKDHAALAEMRERPPRESSSGWRGKLQRAMYGGDQLWAPST
jgi:hypothetical protein